MRSLLVNLVVTVALAATGLPLFAQGDQPDCNVCFFFSDRCDDGTNCATGANCKETTFVVPCDGAYVFACRSVHPNNPNMCYQIMTCTKLFKIDGGTETELSSYTAGDIYCEGGCGPFNRNVFLSPSYTYKLRICMSPCQYSNCGLLQFGYSAARVYWPGASCPEW